MPQIMPIENVTQEDSSIRIDIGGTYLVNFTIILQSATECGYGLTVGVQINGAYVNPSLIANIISSTNLDKNVTVNAITALAANDVLTLTILSPVDLCVTFLPNLNTSLSLVRISD